MKFESITPKNTPLEQESKNPTKNKNTSERKQEFTSRVMDEAEKYEVRPEDRNEKGELLVSPEGPVSNLGKQSEFWWKIARTESFKKFFGDWQNNKENSSKILDKNGEPLIVFRGLRDLENGISFADFYNKDFYSEFNIDNNMSMGPLGFGVHTTPYLEDAFEYAKIKKTESKGLVLAAFVNARIIRQEPEKTLKEYILEGLDQTTKDFALIFSKKLLNYIPKLSTKEKWDAGLIGYTGTIREHNRDPSPEKDGSKSNPYDPDVAEIVVKNPDNIFLLPSDINMSIHKAEDTKSN